MFCQGSWMSIQLRVVLIGLLSSILVLIAPSLESQIQESSDYSHYRIISRDNLFRPLGWTRPIKERRYKLIGTKIDDDGTGWAYMSTSGSRDVMTVFRVGSQIEGVSIKEIASRKVVMENGEFYEQKSVEFLGDEKGRSGRSNPRSGRGSSDSEGKVSESDRPKRRANGTARTSGRNFQRSVSEAQRQEWREARKKFENASSEERLRMIEEFRKNRER